MQKLLMVCLLFTALCVSMGCGKAAPPANASTSSSQEKKQITLKQKKSVEIRAGGKTFLAVLEDNEAARAFSAKLPLTVTMTELNENEKYYRLPERLPSSDQNVGTVHTGDLMLYNGNCIVLFYRDFSTSYSYTRLGRVENPAGLAEALEPGDVPVIFDLP